jgi:hypothetical protein
LSVNARYFLVFPNKSEWSRVRIENLNRSRITFTHYWIADAGKRTQFCLLHVKAAFARDVWTWSDLSRLSISDRRIGINICPTFDSMAVLFFVADHYFNQSDLASDKNG